MKVLVAAVRLGLGFAMRGRHADTAADLGAPSSGVPSSPASIQVPMPDGRGAPPKGRPSLSLVARAAGGLLVLGALCLMLAGSPGHDTSATEARSVTPQHALEPPAATDPATSEPPSRPSLMQRLSPLMPEETQLQRLRSLQEPVETVSVAMTGHTVSLVPTNYDVTDVANEAAALLRQAGIATTVSELSGAGHPDALVLLDRLSYGTSVWFCNPGQPASQALAGPVIKELMALAELSYDSSQRPAVNQLLACGSIHESFPGTAIVLVRMPPRYEGSDAELGAALSTGIAGYFQQDAAAEPPPPPPAPGRMVWPASGPITSYMGPAHPLGIDIGQSRGSILAAHDGVVLFAGGDPCCGYGYYVVIHQPGFAATVYAHLAAIDVAVGERVRAGQAIGVVGCTGHCTGPHLHFEVIANGLRRNPLEFLP